MKKSVLILLVAAGLISASCVRESMRQVDVYPEGTPVMLNIGFGASEKLDVQIGTKAEASIADESRVHDLYVLIFDNSTGKKIKGRYFTYEHMNSDLDYLDAQSSEGWYVRNTLTSESTVTTRGVVKVATEAREHCTLVLLANVSNAIASLNGVDPLDCLADIETITQFNNVQVTLEQHTVNRNDLFLMMETLPDVNTGEMVWGELPDTYNPSYQVRLKTLDAKIKFRVTYDKRFINSLSPQYWGVYNVPVNNYLVPHASDPASISYFNIDEAYFEKESTVGDDVWQEFSFYMLENRPAVTNRIADASAPGYYLRELQVKDPVTGENGNWVYAPEKATYVKFNVVLNLNSDGIDAILGDGSSAKHALTSDGKFVVHLGQFVSSEPGTSGQDFDNYAIVRNNSYTYNIRIVNSTKIYVEVEGDNLGIREDEPGQAGSLLLTTDEIVNCDAHYEYHSMTFAYNESLATDDSPRSLSWHVKTPFSQGGPEYDVDSKLYTVPNGGKMDIAWVLFKLNDKSGTQYSTARASFPGNTEDNPHYFPEWTPDNTDPDKGPVGVNVLPDLMDVNQLVNVLKDQNKKRHKGDPNLFDSSDKLRFTAFVNEFYYETNPISGELETDLWRQFVNAKPRELHILADAKYSEDKESDVITSSFSIIQQSIQTIYNIYSPSLSSIWGTEHLDEMKFEDGSPVRTGWPWIKSELSGVNGDYCKDIENGRYNTAALWGMNPAPESQPRWDTYVNYNVENDEPELLDDYQAMAFSCMTRNRDNNGNREIDPDEIRWYLAAVNQLIGMWVGNEALTPSARIYQPRSSSSTNELEWRAHVVSSTASASKDNPRVLVGEEGVSLYNYKTERWDQAFEKDKSDATWNKVQSVRCVRNVGTYQANGKAADISYAPYYTEVDQYFEAPQGVDKNKRLIPNADGTYTLHFTNLNTRSLREYTMEDLPYHDEYSKHNCVYLELDMQNPENVVAADGSILVDMKTVNENITQKGYNEYCPPGYRLPNMTELALMQALLPSSYWAAGNAPSRTYFSKGIYCEGNVLNPDGTVSTYKYPSEEKKIGWGYKTNMKLVNTGQNVESVRCVRDNNLTGDIMGKVVVPGGGSLQVGVPFDIELNFSSMASSLTDINLSLVFLTPEGVEDTMPIPTDDVVMTGVSLRQTISFTIPDSIPVLGAMAIRATLYNSARQQRSFETPITVVSPVTSGVKLLQLEYVQGDENPTMPVLAVAVSPTYEITGWVLHITDPEGENTEISLPVLSDTHYRSYIYHYDYGSSLIPGIYSFELEVLCGSHPSVRSAAVTMEILKAYFDPNPTPTADLTTASDVANLWEPHLVKNLDFFGGDFIETSMDVSNCVFKEDPLATTTKEHTDQDIGMDDLISIGLNGIDWENGTLHLYYPSHSGDKNYLYFRPMEYSQQTVEFAPDTRLDYRIEKSGIYWNGNKLTIPAAWNNLMERIWAAPQLYVGSIEGKHHSRAYYRFVRVVHNGASKGFDFDHYNGGFTSDPELGGYL